MEIKVCSTCGAVLYASDEYFSKRKDCKSGLNCVCRYCMLLRKRIYKARNKEHIAQQDRSYREQHRSEYATYSRQYRERNPEKQKMLYKQQNARRSEYLKAYRKENRSRILLYKKQYNDEHKEARQQYYEANKERLSENRKLWRDNNRDRRQIANQRRRTLKKALPATLTEEEWKETKEYFSNRCAYCGRKLKLTQDHFVPLSKGGSYTQENIVPACNTCNSSKQTSEFTEWYTNYKYFSENRADHILSYINAMEEK